MPKLTETYISRLPHPKQGTSKHWDSEVRGLVIFVGKKVKTWYFQKDVGGRTRRQLIGRHPSVSANTARQAALELTLEWGRGVGKHMLRAAPTLEAALESYLMRPKLRSEVHKKSLRQQFEHHLKDWMGFPLTDITKAMVVDRHRSLAKKPSAANHLLKYFRTVWNHARRVHDLPECPTVAVEWFEERPEGRIIEDLTKWRATIDGLENPIHAAFYEFLLFTGLRKSEAHSLEWSRVHEDHLHLEVTKNGRSFDLPLLQRHHEILAQVRGLDRRWVFPSLKGSNGHITNAKRISWSAHAHRRTFATVAVEAGVLEEVVGRLLNHTPISITGQRYVRPSLSSLVPHMEVICESLDERSNAKAVQSSDRNST